MFDLQMMFLDVVNLFSAAGQTLVATLFPNPESNASGLVSKENVLFGILTAANILCIICYSVRDILWLRILLVASMLLMLPYYYFQKEALISCICWQAVFIAINMCWIVVILRERRPLDLTASEQQLYDQVFKDCCTPFEMLQLITRAQWLEAESGETIIRKGTDIDQLLLIHNGHVSIRVNDGQVAKLGAGNLVGEMSYLTRQKTVADVVAVNSVRYLSWTREVLDNLFESKSQLKSAINEIIGRDLVQKLSAQNSK